MVMMCPWVTGAGTSSPGAFTGGMISIRSTAWWLGIGSIISESTRPRWVAPGSATPRTMVTAPFSTPPALSRGSHAPATPGSGVEHDAAPPEQVQERPGYLYAGSGESALGTGSRGEEPIRHASLGECPYRQGGCDVGHADEFPVLLTSHPVGQTHADHSKAGDTDPDLFHHLSSDADGWMLGLADQADRTSAAEIQVSYGGCSPGRGLWLGAPPSDRAGASH